MTRIFLLFLGFAPMTLAHAGGDVGLVFASGFESGEGCILFDGVGDQVRVRAVAVSGDFTINGGAFPAVEYDDGNFQFRDRLSGDSFPLGNSHDQSYTVNVMPGTYDVIYSVETRGTVAPHNVGAVVMENVLINDDRVLDIDLVVHTISGDFLHGGSPFPAVEYDDGLFYLDSDVAGRVFVGNSHDQVFNSVPVLAGDYEIRFAVETIGDTVPRHEWGYVGPLPVAGNLFELQVDVQTIELSGDFTHNGAPFPLIEYDDGNFYLETDAGDRVHLGNSHEGSYQRFVIPGNYDVFFEVESPGATMPFNERARVASGVDVSGGTADIDLVSHAVTGTFRLNGGAFPVLATESAEIILRDPVAGIDNLLGYSYEGSYAHRIVEGNYDVVYSRWKGTSEVPQNRNHTLTQGVLIDSPGTMDVEVASRLFSASVYHNGALFPADSEEKGRIMLLDPDSPDLLQMGETSQQHLSVHAIPGTYDIYYAYTTGDDMPVNSLALIVAGHEIAPPGPVLQGGGFQIDVNSRVIAGSMLLNDALFPASDFDDGLLYLQGTPDLILLGLTHHQAYQLRIVDDPSLVDYWVYYGVQSLGASVPANGFGRAHCVRLEPPPPL